MASSVSSEHAFSSAGITISKCQNQLNWDIVEALQCLKCLLHQDLIFHEPAPSSAVEVLEEELADDGILPVDIETMPADNLPTWDDILMGDGVTVSRYCLILSQIALSTPPNPIVLPSMCSFH
jgi:hypothetical protein